MKKSSKKTAAAESSAPKQIHAEMVLKDIRLVASQAGFPVDAPSPEEMEQKINIQTIVANEESKFISIITFFLRDPATDEQHRIFISASFAILYDVKDIKKKPPEFFQSYGQQGCLFQVWAYWREFVQSMTTRAGLPALRIPALTPGELNNFEFIAEQPNSGGCEKPKAKLAAKSRKK